MKKNIGEISLIRCIWFVIFLSCLTGCSTIARESVMATWIGHPIDELTAKMGAPTSKIPRNDGGVVYTWITFGDQQCNQNYITNSKGMIISWSFSGCSKYLNAY